MNPNTASLAQCLDEAAVQARAVPQFAPGSFDLAQAYEIQRASMARRVARGDGTQLPALKDSALGTYAATFWGPDFQNPTSKAFTAAFEKKHGRIPSQYAAQAYDSALLIDSALKKTGGSVSDKKSLRDALRAADYASLRGNYKFGVNGFPVQDFHIFEVAKDNGGRVSLKTIATPLKAHQDAYVGECK